MTTRRAAWRRSDDVEVDEHCTLTLRDGGLSLVGTVLGAEAGQPVRIEYRVLADRAGLTTAAHVRDLRGFETRTVALEREREGQLDGRRRGVARPEGLHGRRSRLQPLHEHPADPPAAARRSARRRPSRPPGSGSRSWTSSRRPRRTPGSTSSPTATRAGLRGGAVGRRRRPRHVLRGLATHGLRDGPGRHGAARRALLSSGWGWLRHVGGVGRCRRIAATAATTSSAEPMNPNQNGAVMPNALASRPPIGDPITSPADDRDAVDAAHAAEDLVRHGALTDDRRCRAPDEAMDAEDDHRRRSRRPPTSSAQGRGAWPSRSAARRA